MKHPLIDDERWRSALTMAAPGLESSSTKAITARERCEYAAQFLKTAAQTESAHEHYATWAAAGEVFIEGLRALRKLGHIADVFDGSPQLRNRGDSNLTLSLPDISDEFIDDVTRHCAIMFQIHTLIAQDEQYKTRSRNSKPDLHQAVDIIWRVWLDLTDRLERTKKDFIDFAHYCLEPTRCVTWNAIHESYDRHVRHDKKTATRSTQGN